jgi:hypothetical protein
MKMRFTFTLLLLTLLGASRSRASEALFRTNDVVGFVGGADVSAAQQTAHLESLLVAAYPGIRCRNFGWEGDTVFEQPRDFGFPPLTNHLQRAGVTVLLIQFGRSESLVGPAKVGDFTQAYRQLLKSLRPISPRMILVTPPPFEKAAPPLPDLSLKNETLAKYSEAIHSLAQEEMLPVIELFQGLLTTSSHLTEDGLQLTAFGQGRVAQKAAEALDLKPQLRLAGDLTPSGAWSNPQYEQLRQAIISKNRLWFNYWRPQNWAFLGGDRTSQPSSRDYRNPAIRWFPTEIEKFNDLIAAREKEIFDLSRRLQ